jgi:quercetin dioxygenase-like cupin family protein
MKTRRAFLQSAGLISSLFFLPDAFGKPGDGDGRPQPLLTNRTKKNSYWYIGHLMSVLAGSKQTGGRYALLRATERRGLEPPPHTHTREDETFLILKGEVVYTVGGRNYEAKEGDVMFLPRNIQHSFKIRTETLETLILLNPGGLENYFVEMSEPAGDLMLPPMPQGPPDIQRLIETASKYGVRFPKMRAV